MVSRELGNVKISLSDLVYESIENQMNGIVAPINPIDKSRVIVIYGDRYYSKDDLHDYINGIDWTIDTSASNINIDSSLGHIEYKGLDVSSMVIQGVLSTGLEGLDSVNIDFTNLIKIINGKISIDVSFGELFNIPFVYGENILYQGILGLAFLDEVDEKLSLLLNFFPFNDYKNIFKVKSNLILGE